MLKKLPNMLLGIYTVLTVVSVFHALETPDLKSCGLCGLLLLCSASDELELRSTGATKLYVVAAMN